MKNCIQLLSVLAVLGFAVQPAHAALDLSIVGNLTPMNLNVNPEPANKTSANLGLGLGALASFDLANSFTFNTGLVYTSQAVSTDVLGVNTVNSFNYLRIPAMAHYWIIPQLSVGAGMYYAMGLGDVSTKVNGGAATTASYDASGISKSDFGVILGSGFKMPAGAFSIVANANYLLGLKDLNAPTVANASTKWNGFEFQAGVSFGI